MQRRRQRLGKIGQQIVPLLGNIGLGQIESSLLAHKTQFTRRTGDYYWTREIESRLISVMGGKCRDALTSFLNRRYGAGIVQTETRRSRRLTQRYLRGLRDLRVK